jgi:streptogramin lyase
MYWNVDCIATGSLSGGQFQVSINGGSGHDVGVPLNDVPQFDAGTNYYSDTGTFSLSINSDCEWTIEVSPQPQFFTQAPGAATDVAVGANGSVWVVGTIPGANGNLLYKWTGLGWAPESGQAVRIAVGPDGSPWVVDSHNRIYHLTGARWTQLPGAATDISVGANGSVWVVGTIPGANGNLLYKWTGTGWAPESGQAVRIAVGPDGSPWVVDSHNRIYHLTGAGWTQLPGAATDISVGANGSVWVVGTIPGANGYLLYSWTGTGWAPEPGQAVTIAVDPHGSPWIVDSRHDIFAA